jgi:hypothetical protein
MLGYSLSLMPRQDCYITQEPDKNQEKNKENQRRLMSKVQSSRLVFYSCFDPNADTLFPWWMKIKKPSHFTGKAFLYIFCRHTTFW